MVPKIVWLPWWLALPGSKVDVQMSRHTEIIDYLEDWEFVVVDKGYLGLDKVMIPIKGRGLDLHQKTWNSAINSVRVDVERVIHEIKIYDCLRLPWRHDRSLHPKVFGIAGHLANLRMESEPIRRFPNHWLL